VNRAALTPAQAQRRYVGLTALRWLPIGIAAPVTVLLATSRGLSPADVGLTVAVYGAVTLLLELPTGGLADAVGHRPVLVLSGLLGTAALLLMTATDDVGLFALAWAVHGAGRALDSGPLEAWYIDTVHAADAAADVTPGLSRAGAADGLGLALGAALGGLVPLLAADAGSTALALPLFLAAALTLVSVAGVRWLVVPLRTSEASAGRALLAGLRQVPPVVRATVGLVGRDRVLRRLLAVSFLTGTVLTALELLGPLHFADLAGSLAEGSAVSGVVMAVSFGAAGVGSLLAPAARRAARGSVAWVSAVSAGCGAAAVVAVALAPGVAVAAVGYALFHLCNGCGWPLRAQLLHEQTTSAQRATTVSATSLALMLGGLLGSLVLPRLAEVAGNPAGLLTSAVAALLIALVSLGLRPRRPGTPGRTRVAALHG
jgi:MFS family permease